MIKIGYQDPIWGPVFKKILGKGLDGVKIQWIEANDLSLANSIEKGELDLALITPLGYARIKEGATIHPNFLLYSIDGAKHPLLFFREALREIAEVRYPAEYEGHFYQIISEIVCNEFLNFEAEWVTHQEISYQAQELLKKYPVVWVPDIKTILMNPGMENYIDLSEIWSDHTDLPFIYYLLAVSEAFQEKEILERIGNLFSTENENVYAIVRDIFPATFSAESHPNISFFAFPEIWEALEEILKFLFYYNQAEYIPELKFCKLTV